jgi:hypothetical protein
MDEKKRQEIALKRFALISPAVNGFEQNVAAYLFSPQTGWRGLKGADNAHAEAAGIF